VTTGIETTVGDGGGVGGLAWGTWVAGGGGGSEGAGTKTSAGLAAGVTIRATVCFVERHVGNVARAAPAAASARIEDQRRERVIGGSLVALGVYPENREPEKRRSGPAGSKRLEREKAPILAPAIV
jgi:hypothetical protein